MIDLTGSGMATALSPPVPAERRDEGGPAFAVLLAQAAVSLEASPMPQPVPEPVAMPGAEVMPVPQRDDAPGRVRRAIVDHAIRFDARGMIAMAAGADCVSTTMPVAAAPLVPDRVSVPPTPIVSLTDRVLPAGVTTHAIRAMASAMPVGRVEAARPGPVPIAATTTAPGEATPDPSRRPDEPEAVTAPAARQRTRFATMAQGAPKVAIVALADGLAVSAAVGALPDSERHRMRDAIAATLSRHGLRPRAVTLLAMPAPLHVTER